MGKKDTVTKKYMEDNATFADVFNFLIYDGRQVIKPEQLKAVDTTEIALPYGGKNELVSIQKLRDVAKLVVAMEDENAAYCLLAVENQSEIHEAMPPKNMLYDAIDYVAQVDDISKAHIQNGDKPKTSSDYLSGFYRSDKLLPVITLTLYFGANKWDAPKSIHEMLSVQNKELLRFVPDYRINLISPADIADEEFSKFHTELSLVLKYIKYSKDKKKLRQMVQEDSAFTTVSRRTADMIKIVTESNHLHYSDGEERVNMCEAIEGIRNDALAEGKAEGREEGRIEGILSTLASLVKDEILTIADAAARANMSVSEFETKAGLR